MERGSDKHGPKVDDEMKLETSSMTQGAQPETRREEALEKEPPADGEPVPDDRIRGGKEPIGSSGLTEDEVEARQEFARHIPGAVFPGTRDDIIEGARSMNAPEPIVARLETLPEKTYDRFPDVWEQLGGRMEGDRE